MEVKNTENIYSFLKYSLVMTTKAVATEHSRWSSDPEDEHSKTSSK